MIDRYIDIKQLSRLLSIKEKTLYDWARNGKIPSCKRHGLLRFKESEIEEFMEEGRRETVSRKKRAERISEEILTRL